MGTRGPVPKRSDMRHGHRSKAEAAAIDQPSGAENVEQPAVDESWHPIAQAIFDSLAQSGQSQFYEPSDWAQAVLMCESISRDLKPQFVGFTDSGDVITESIPLKGASLNAYRAQMAALLMAEGDRRRAAVELQKGGEAADPQEEHEATVTELRAIAGDG